jgi:antitoxin CptB
MSEPESVSLDTRRRRLLYRATHRGTYENDILFGGFVWRHIATFDQAELAALEALLDVPENEMADWLTGRLPIPEEAETPMLRRMRGEAQSASQEDADGRAKPGHDDGGCVGGRVR